MTKPFNQSPEPTVDVALGLHLIVSACHVSSRLCLSFVR